MADYFSGAEGRWLDHCFSTDSSINCECETEKMASPSQSSDVSGLRQPPGEAVRSRCRRGSPTPAWDFCSPAGVGGFQRTVGRPPDRGSVRVSLVTSRKGVRADVLTPFRRSKGDALIGLAAHSPGAKASST